MNAMAINELSSLDDDYECVHCFLREYNATSKEAQLRMMNIERNIVPTITTVFFNLESAFDCTSEKNKILYHDQSRV